MASILESLSHAWTPDMVGQLGNAVGLDNTLVSKGLGVVGPLLTGALANAAAKPEGLEGLMQALPRAEGGAGLGNLVSMITSGGAPASVMSRLFGSGYGAITSTLDKSLGFKVSPLIGLAAPFVMNLVAQKVSAQKLDAGGVAQLLSDEQAAFATTGGETARLVQQALEAGKEAGAIRSRYSDDQWVRLRLAPFAAARAVMAASPSGLVGTAKEMAAGLEALERAREAMGPTALANLAFETKITEEELGRLGDQPSASLAIIRETASTIAAQSPAEAAGFGKLLVDIATSVAEASKEGGFLGIGGTRVSKEEQAAIDQVKAAAGLAAFKAGA